MTYPKTFLTRPVRRAFMFSLVSIFLLTAPAIILYTAGYRYDVRQGRVKQTGVVSIDVQPASARVYFNDLLIRKRMPIRLTNRAPGTYQVRIEHDGYKPWIQDVTVDSNQTTYIRDITLFADTLPYRIGAEQHIDDAIFSEDGRYILATNAVENVYTTLVYDIRTNTWTTITRTTERPTLLWSPYQPMAFVIHQEHTQATIIRFDPTQKSILAVYTFDTLGDELLDHLQWHPTNAEAYIQEEDSIYLLSSEKQFFETTTATLWHVDEQRRLWTYTRDSRQIRNDEQTFLLPGDISIEHILSITDSYILLNTLRGITIVRRADGDIQTIPANHVRYDTVAQRWIAWSPIEIWTIHRDGSIHLEDRLSNTTITHVTPLHSYHSLLFSTEDSIAALNPGYATRHTLFSDINVKSVIVNEQQRIVYFLGMVGTQRGIFALPLRH